MNIAEKKRPLASNPVIETEDSFSLGASNEDVEFSDRSKLPVQPLVSIDMITYQHAPFIREALDSVLMQKVDFPYEICIGEDGSTDGTREICLDYARKYPDKIRLFLRNRSNPARNAFKAPYMFNATSTFDACRGRYIAPLEGDDYWLHPHKLRLQVDQLESDSSLAASCHYAASAEDGKPWGWSITPNHSVKSFSLTNLLKRDVGNLHTSTWLLRRGRPVDWKQFRVSSFGDYPVIVSTLLQGTAMVTANVWSLYRIHKGGVFSPLSNEIRWRENVELWNCLRSVVPTQHYEAATVGLSRTLAMYARTLSKTGKYGAALACLRNNFSEIAKIHSSRADQFQLRLFALEAVLIPHLQGLRERWKIKKLKH